MDDLVFVESARWHDGRFWFAHWSAGEVISTDLEGNHTIEASLPDRRTLGWSIDWLPDGALLVTGSELLRQEPDGSFRRHADLTSVATHNWNEIVVDRWRGNVYVNGADVAELSAGQMPPAGIIAIVRPDGSAEQVALDIAFPNGMVITPDGSTLVVAESMRGRLTAFSICDDGSLSNRRVWSDHVAPDGICIDADGAIWCGAGDTARAAGQGGDPPGAAVRVREGGEIVERVELDRPGFSYALGGPGGRTLFAVGQHWRGFDQIESLLADRTGRAVCVEVTVPAPAGPQS